ncbi:HEXXH motif domain-containing protein [Amycolatopsis pigmentata]|uniref:HEXXH motif domain-containing protein n=1 Tax=Amycolatopsis pigmentata TaxID=450801 RepID=A0ABW5FUI9_9PSEU
MTDAITPGLEPLRRHTLALDVFERACRGPLPPDDLSAQFAAQYSRRKLLLRTLLDRLGTNTSALGPLPDAGATWHILATAEERAPGIVGDVLMYPPVGAWVTRMIRRLLGAIDDNIPLWTELGYLHSLTAAVAFRAAIPFSLGVPVLFGAVNLPTVGQLRLPGRFPTGVASLEHDRDGLHVRSGVDRVTLSSDEETAFFLPTRSQVCVSDHGVLRFRFDDTDPYREFTSPRPPRRVDHTEFAEWDKLFAEAWDLLSAHHPRYATELASTLAMLAPASAGHALFAASSRAAFGGMLVSPKSSAALLAEVLVHELQHSKFNALLDLVPLLRDEGDETLYAPWRDDPRPAAGLLHGIYAFTSTVEFNQTHRNQASGPEARLAEYLFARRRAQVRETIEIARDLPELTRPGRRFVDLADERLARCEQDRIDDGMAEVVAHLNAGHRAGWRWCHHDFAADEVENLTAGFLRGAEAGGLPRPTVVPHRREPGSTWRFALLKLKVLDPAGFAEAGPVPPADRAFAAGDHHTAAIGYRERIATDPGDSQAWIGLGLALRVLGDREAADGILGFPALVVAIHERIRATVPGPTPDPAALAGWLGRGTPTSA